MNKGEAARIAAKSKSGQIGIYLFKEPEKRKKKFSYKSRTQGYSVRKVATNENPPGTVSRPQTELSQKGSTALKKKDAPKKPVLKNNNAAKTKHTKSEQDVNFVAKNIQAQKKKKKQVSSANTVTLTQDQLNKILQTLGGENASLKFENGDIRIEDKTDERNNQDHKEDNIPKGKSDRENEEINTNVQPIQSKETVSNATENNGPNQNNVDSSNQHDIEEQKDVNRTQVINDNESTTSPRTNLGDIANCIGTTGFNDKDDAERRRRQWREELDKQVAEKQKEKERMKKVRLSGDSAEQWSPWGNLGDSGGRSQRKVDVAKQVVQSVIYEEPKNQVLNSKPEPPSSRVDYSYRQANTPAAMRSSFSFGNYSDESKSIKQKEKEAWLQELEKQRQDAKERQAKEKQQRRGEVGIAENDYWARQVPIVKRSVSPQSMETKDDIATEEKRKEIVRSETVQSDPLSGTTASQETIITPRGHQRSQWGLTDPAEVERREKARNKHLEHMEAVKAQVEEKQKLKREAMERKRREDKEEEEKLARERENLQKQFEMEAQKQKQKELDALAKHQALVESMQRAYEESMRLKQEKRKRHLNINNSDAPTSMPHREGGTPSQTLPPAWAYQLKSPPLDALAKHQALVESMQRAYEESMRLKQEKRKRHLNINNSDAPTSMPHREDEPVVPTPRIGGSHGPVQRTPPPPPVATEVATIPQETGVRHSVVIEQGVQTDFATGQDDVSPRLADRDKSAGIEYKQHRIIDNSKNSVMPKNDSNTRKMEDRKSPVEDQNKEIEIKVRKKKTVKISERPKWGVKSEPKKKVKASDKDLTVSKKVREERRKKRMQELLSDQERNMPAPRTGRESRKARNQEDSPAFKVLNCADGEIDEILKYEKRNEKRHTSKNNREELHAQEERVVRSRPEELVDSSQTPPLQTGDFVPFLRTDERLDVDSLPVTPAEYRDAQNLDNDNVNPEPPRRYQHQQNYKDPLFSPDIRKDGENRQKMILKQLSNLRQGLMMKQREMELGLSVTPLST
ncbi:coiled-coil domain-containing protein 66-like [Anneissia japonica]|uniref:coiled-coil domain-containing protein 66-like n=1 Tax=Anneissia japonica TaxID=1529436 RepID=UPI0014254C96|nr:coiled-coil domain-containing protein 66-like [Anneissia japonica]